MNEFICKVKRQKQDCSATRFPWRIYNEHVAVLSLTLEMVNPTTEIFYVYRGTYIYGTATKRSI